MKPDLGPSAATVDLAEEDVPAVVVAVARAAVAAGIVVAVAIAIGADAAHAGRVFQRSCRDAACRVSTLNQNPRLQCIMTDPPFFFFGGRIRKISGNIPKKVIDNNQKTSLNDMMAACCRTIFSTAPFAIL
jgi:hypothetical protein